MTVPHVAPSSPPTVSPAPRRHRRWFFISAAAVFLVSLVAAAAWSVVGLLAAWNAPDDFARTDLPGTVGVTVTGPGSEGVAVRSTDLTMEYDAHAGDLGTAIGSFEAPEQGTYVVTGTAGEPGTSLAVGESPGGARRPSILTRP